MEGELYVRLGYTMDALYRSITRHLAYSLGVVPTQASKRDIYLALSYSVRDRLLEKMLKTNQRYEDSGAKRLYYLSMEFLIGRSLANNLRAMKIYDQVAEALQLLGTDVETICDQERDAALGNGGLGRLAACFLDSMASLDMPGFGYGLHYDYGLFEQDISNGYQREKPDSWISEAPALQVERADAACIVPMYGRIEETKDKWGRHNPLWLGWNLVTGVPYDIPIAGYGGLTVNRLRLFAARPSTEFDIKIFNEGDYLRAVEQKIESEKISKILYPKDSYEAGRELRLIQEYFLVACSLNDIVRTYEKDYSDFNKFPEKVAIQLNDTHPALAVAELMRILVDQKWVPWERAWDITNRTIAYTNHTLLPEALEKWPESLLARLLPRHLQFIYDINQQFLDRVVTLWPGDVDRMRNMSIMEEGPPRQVRMANLAIVGAHSVNGVSALHTDLIKKSLAPNFFEMWPERFNNKTNGITPRRWLCVANPNLHDLIEDAIGPGFVTDLERLRELEPFAEDPAFCEKFMQVKHGNKERLKDVIFNTTVVEVDPASLFDVQVKRIHEYKRQLMNVLGIIWEYLALTEDGVEPVSPKTFIFAGKAAPGYWAAKQLIKLIHNVGNTIEDDPRARDFLKVAFAPNFRVTLAEQIIPAADISQQISTAGFEASGTGNMKFALNGALTIGTMDGANIEISQKVGRENIYICGLTAYEIEKMKRAGSYKPKAMYDKHPMIKRVVDSLASDRFCPRESGLFAWLKDYLLADNEMFFHLADLESYVKTRELSTQEYVDKTLWAKKAILNVARVGHFSSDRTIRQYAEEIWDLVAIPPTEAEKSGKLKYTPSDPSSIATARAW
ncbi:glycogen/starch/alpha-glucan phosphorylase [Desulfatibacillum aliphaticivorans]|uniref:Alpha-1,4 glucan phosphorylase n=1 Tax=Desulfatibacillum aliphaticivorans TaxID=218208 RepID=B8FN13_DESAL|nr:glycogen/starch/alpha-glucan phosphorylase [Desulfatibacillum aliphaticivorans]ACL05883.1 glycogen/starch/alpha-glucan phosphorylase [Desulfatibacillum aliphaticivorans]